MVTQKNSIDSIQKSGAISGILSILLYLSAILPFLPDYLGRLAGFAFPLLWIISFMGLYSFLKEESYTPSLEIAYIFGIIGGALACILIVVQQANILWDIELQNTANYELYKDFYQATYGGVNRVQAGMDVAFDIFITISWILFGLNIAESQSFNKIIGWTGSLLALILLVLNLYTFPNGPAEAGLFDLGPFLGLWVLVFYIWFTIVVFKKKIKPDLN